MRIESEVKLDFKDVLIRPKRSTLKSRSEVSLTRTFQLKHARRSLTCTPIIAANMDTTGTFPMATALARVGALTAVHKHYTPEEWVAWAEEQRLAAARAAAGIIMEDGSHPEPEDADDARMPPAAAAAATAPAASATAAGAVDGIADGATRPSPRAPRLRPTLTPRSGTYTHGQGTYTPLGGAHRALASAVTVTTAATLTLPALAAVAVSAGTAAADLARVRAVTQAVPEVGLLCLDVANGYSEGFVDTVRHYRDEFPSIAIMAGNVVTGEMVEELVLSGADIIKVGIGPGSVCTTRKKTGVGYPQLSAVIECADAAHGLGALVVSDGGCTNPGDIAKAIGAGADLVMLGGMLAGHDESGGKVVERVCLATGPQPPKAQRGGRRGSKGEAPLVDTDLTGAAAGAAAAAAAAALSANEANQDDDDDDDDGEGDDDGEEGEERPEGGSGRSRGRGGRGRRMVRGEAVPLTPKTVPLTTGSSSTDAPLSTSNPLLVTRAFKEFYGMSSAVAMSRHHGGVAEYRASEGKAILCPYRGPVERTMQDILGGLRSACTYVGAAEVKDLSKRTTFIRVTQQTNDVFGVERE